MMISGVKNMDNQWWYTLHMKRLERLCCHGRDNQLVKWGVIVCALSTIIFIVTPDETFVNQLKTSSPIPFILAFGMFGGLTWGVLGLIIETWVGNR
jgi:hypothetical protein